MADSPLHQESSIDTSWKRRIKPMKALICGPITGSMKDDWPEFKYYEDKLRFAGIDVINPLRVLAKLGKNLGAEAAKMKKKEMTVSDKGWKWVREMSFILDTLTFCDAIFMMPRWNQAMNSLVAVLAAKELGLRLLYYNGEDLCERQLNLIGEFDDSKHSKTFDLGDSEGKIKELSPEEYQEMKEDLLAQDRAAASQSKEDKPPPAEKIEETATEEEIERETDELLRQARLDEVGNWLAGQFGKDFLKKRGARDAEDD